MIVLENSPEIAKFVNDQGNGCRLMAKGKKHGSTRPVWLIAVKERMVGFYSDYSTQFNNTLVMIWCKFLIIGTIVLLR